MIVVQEKEGRKYQIISLQVLQKDGKEYSQNKLCETMNPCLNGGGSSFLATCIIQCMEIIKAHI